MVVKNARASPIWNVAGGKKDVIEPRQQHNREKHTAAETDRGGEGGVSLAAAFGRGKIGKLGGKGKGGLLPSLIGIRVGRLTNKIQDDEKGSVAV